MREHEIFEPELRKLIREPAEWRLHEIGKKNSLRELVDFLILSARRMDALIARSEKR